MPQERIEQLVYRIRTIKSSRSVQRPIISVPAGRTYLLLPRTAREYLRLLAITTSCRRKNVMLTRNVLPTRERHAELDSASKLRRDGPRLCCGNGYNNLSIVFVQSRVPAACNVMLNSIQHPGCEGMGLGYAAGTATTTCPSYSYNQEFPQHTEGRRRTAGCTKRQAPLESAKPGGKEEKMVVCATTVVPHSGQVPHNIFLRNLPSVLLLRQNVPESLKSRAPN